MTDLFFALLIALAQTPPVPAPETPVAPSGAPGVVSASDKARAAVAANDLLAALRELQDAAKADPQAAPPRVTLASLLVAAGRAPEARNELERAAREDPKHPDVHLMNARLALADGRATEALLDSRAAIEFAAAPRWEPDQRQRFVREGRLTLALALERRQDFAAAEEPLRAILSQEPKNGPARFRLAAALFYQGKPDAAFAELRTAAADDLALTQPELQMADFYASKNEATKADEWRKKAVAARPDDYRPLRAIASALLDQGKFEEATPYIEAGGKLDPSGQEMLPIKGFWYRYKKQYAEAAEVFEQLHRDSPGKAVYAWNLALSLAETGDKKKQRQAIELAEAQTRANSRTPEAFAVLGWCYYKAGLPDQAERSLLTAAQLGPLSTDAGYFLARLFADRKRDADAVAALKAVLANTGAFVYRPEAKALLAEVEKRTPPIPAKP